MTNSPDGKVDQNSAGKPSRRLPQAGAEDNSVEAVAIETRKTRVQIGVAAVICLVIGVSVWFMGQRNEVAGAFVRVGILAAATCSAYPALLRIRWRPKNAAEKAVLYVLAILVVLRPRVFIPLALILAVLMIFKMPGKKS